MFDYEQSIWGRGEASKRWSDPTSFRLRQALAALRRLPAGSLVLEVGCGAGQFIRAIKQARPELNCHGSDISQAAITRAQEQRDGASYAVSAPYQLPHPSATFDAIVFFDVLEHVDNPARLLQEIRRVLKPSGLLYGFVPCEGDWTSLWYWLDKFQLKKDLTKKYAGHLQYFSRAALRQLLADNGWRIIRRRYSEHLVGQLAGVITFFLMNRLAKQQGLAQLNNEQFFAPVGSGSAFSRFKRLANVIIFCESSLLRFLPSPNVHLAAVKQKSA
ncbi:MAG: methyltransferase domain-containing protein [Candidatus Magasanikbacteria bacterium]|nr:methyltransferase domain-containing protein [Candidatus Magasanikbacteria bacterium]